ncbi:MAG: hypothetical protein SF182_07650 [Deltaproteobacteria bacterium]|nr:hypothetical protein [Deltaproteobacteria bacterium]
MNGMLSSTRDGTRALHFAVLLVLLSAGVARAQGADPFAICTKQRYALCAAAECLVYNQVAYCNCDVERGNSISEADAIASGDICDVNRAGYGNGYMMSTYSLPEAVIAGGDQAVYTCPGETSDGAYAQCDGGVCFASTRARRFPGFATRLKANDIICSCPITVADPQQSSIGYQFIGPYPCQESYFDYCRRDTANTRTGSHILVGAPTGTPRLLTMELNGSVPPLNHCEPRP